MWNDECKMKNDQHFTKVVIASEAKQSQARCETASVHKKRLAATFRNVLMMNDE